MQGHVVQYDEHKKMPHIFTLKSARFVIILITLLMYFFFKRLLDTSGFAGCLRKNTHYLYS